MKPKKRRSELTGNTIRITSEGTRLRTRLRRGELRAPESARQATLPIPDHAFQAGNRPVSETRPGSGLQSPVVAKAMPGKRRPSRGWKIASGRFGRKPEGVEKWAQ